MYTAAETREQSASQGVMDVNSERGVKIDF
jgi:hypothetical protein